MVRGGGWNNQANTTRCAYRNRNQPTNRNNDNGVRVVVLPSTVHCRGTVFKDAVRVRWKRPVSDPGLSRMTGQTEQEVPRRGW